MEQTTEAISRELLSLGTPDLYRTNLFRILGLSINTSVSDIRRQQKRMAMKQKLGIADDSSQEASLALTPTPDETTIRCARERLSDPQSRLLDEIFWFWPLNDNGKNDPALMAIEKGELTKALNQWRDFSGDGAGGDIAAHNLAVHYHLIALDTEAQNGALESIAQTWNEALFYWKQVIDTEGFWMRVKIRVRELDDVRLTTGFVRRIRQALPEVLLKINAEIALKAAENGDADRALQHIDILRRSPFDEALVDQVLRQTLTPLRQRIRLMCKAVDEEVDRDPKNAHSYTCKFINEGLAILKIVDLLLPKQDAVRAGLHDDIASAAMGCAITFGNETEEWKKALGLYDLLRPIALGEATTGRIEQNYAIVKRNYAAVCCFFCEDETYDDLASIKNHMYGNVQVLGTTITWNHRPVLVPRCNTCRKKHMKANGWGFAAAIGISIAVGAKIGLLIDAGLTPDVFVNIIRLSAVEGLGFFLNELFQMVVFFRSSDGCNVGAVISLIVLGPILFFWLRSGIIRKRYHIKPYGMWKMHPLISELMARKWRFGQGPPQQ
jgi:hypothetical protein